MSLSKYVSAFCFLLAASSGALAEPVYTMTFLPRDFYAAALDPQGRVVGTAGGGAAIWSTASTTYLNALLPGSEGLAINGAGAVAGRVGNSGFVYDGGAVTTFALPGAQATWANGINGAGQVAGVGRLGFGEHTGFRYEGGGFTDMGNFGAVLGVANAINASGQLAGFAGLSLETWYDPERHAAVFADGTLRDLGTLGGRVSEANDINDAGFVAGWSELADGFTERPFLFSPTDASLLDLGSLGGSAGRANGINNAGTVVGLSGIADPDAFDYHAFVWGAAGMLDLNMLVAGDGWTLVTATDVNDAGQILAQACNGALSECRAVRLDLIPAVPEPGAWSMACAGLVLLLWRARRRTLSFAAASLLAAPLAAAQEPPQQLPQQLPHYTPTFLPAGFTATAINAGGQVSGYNGSAALWDENGVRDYAAVAPGSQAHGLDNRGQLVGTWLGDAYAFAPGALRDVGRQGLWDSAFAVAINDAGIIAGRAFWVGGERTRGFVLAYGVLRMIPSLGGDWSEVAAINRSGQVAGTAAGEGPFVNPATRAFIYRDRSMRALGTLGGERSAAADINDAAEVVGNSETGEEDELGNLVVRPFLYAGGVMRDLGALDQGSSYGAARGLDNAGRVVGETLSTTFEQRAFLWLDGTMHDLNALSTLPPDWLLVTARDINDAGQILARACRFEDCLYVRLDPAPAS